MLPCVFCPYVSNGNFTLGLYNAYFKLMHGTCFLDFYKNVISSICGARKHEINFLNTCGYVSYCVRNKDLSKWRFLTCYHDMCVRAGVLCMRCAWRTYFICFQYCVETSADRRWSVCEKQKKDITSVNTTYVIFVASHYYYHEEM